MPIHDRLWALVSPDLGRLKPTHSSIQSLYDFPVWRVHYRSLLDRGGGRGRDVLLVRPYSCRVVLDTLLGTGYSMKSLRIDRMPLIIIGDTVIPSVSQSIGGCVIDRTAENRYGYVE